MHAKIQDLSLALVMCTQDQYHPGGGQWPGDIFIYKVHGWTGR